MEAWAKYQKVQLGIGAEEAIDLLNDGWPHPSDVPYDEWATTWHLGDDVIEVSFDNQHRVGRKWARIQGHEFSLPPTEPSW